MKNRVKRFGQFVNEGGYDDAEDRDDLNFSPEQEEYLRSMAGDSHRQYRELEGRLADEQSLQTKGAIIWNPETSEIEVMFLADPMRDIHGFEDEKRDNPEVEIYFVEFMNDSSSVRTVGGKLDLEDVKVLGRL